MQINKDDNQINCGFIDHVLENKYTQRLGYLPIIGIITGTARIAFHAMRLAQENTGQKRSRKHITHIVRGVGEILSIILIGCTIIGAIDYMRHHRHKQKEAENAHSNVNTYSTNTSPENGSTNTFQREKNNNSSMIASQNTLSANLNNNIQNMKDRLQQQLQDEIISWINTLDIPNTKSEIDKYSTHPKSYSKQLLKEDFELRCQQLNDELDTIKTQPNWAEKSSKIEYALETMKQNFIRSHDHLPSIQKQNVTISSAPILDTYSSFPICGIRNWHGNNCYFNTALQLLTHSRALDYFIFDRKVTEPTEPSLEIEPQQPIPPKPVEMTQPRRKIIAIPDELYTYFTVSQLGDDIKFSSKYHDEKTELFAGLEELKQTFTRPWQQQDNKKLSSYIQKCKKEYEDYQQQLTEYKQLTDEYTKANEEYRELSHQLFQIKERNRQKTCTFTQAQQTFTHQVKCQQLLREVISNLRRQQPPTQTQIEELYKAYRQQDVFKESEGGSPSVVLTTFSWLLQVPDDKYLTSWTARYINPFDANDMHNKPHNVCVIGGTFHLMTLVRKGEDEFYHLSDSTITPKNLSQVNQLLQQQWGSGNGMDILIHTKGVLVH